MNDTPAERGAATWWGALRRRKVVQWGLVYVAAAWGFLQGLQYVSDAFQWPPAVRQVALLAALVGLPVVLVLAWYHGDRGEQRFRGTEIAIITLLFLVGGGIFWMYDRASETATTSSSAANAPAALPLEEAVAPDEKSIAVLPFADMSPAKDQEYMSDGVAEELLNLLAKVPDLKVIARTSSFAFKGEQIEIVEIAKKLNVAHVLEGSVRKSGNTVRITAQLIRASDSTHLWSETYDRELADILTVQDEIAGAIVEALQIRLTGGRLGRREGGTENLDAYQLYLRGISALNENTRSSLEEARDYFEQATQLDPSYGLAWHGVGNYHSLMADNGFVDATIGYERARQLTRHALELSPDLVEGHTGLQYVHQTLDWDWRAAKTEERRALAIDPTNPLALQAAGKLSTTLGRWDEAERQFRLALVRDPLEPFTYWNLGLAYYLSGRLTESEATYRKIFELSPDFLWTRSYLAKTLVAQGKPDAALAVIEQEADEPSRLTFLPVFLYAAGRNDEGDAALKAQIAEWGETCPYCVAQTYAYRDEQDRAFEWLEQAYQRRDATLVEIVGEPLLRNLVDDPRFKAFLRKMNLPEPVPPAS